MKNTNEDNYSSIWLVISLVVMVIVASIPEVNSLTPRLSSDLKAFTGLGLFGLVTSYYLTSSNTTFTLNTLSLLCGFWMLLAVLQWLFGISNGPFSLLLIQTSYLAGVVLLANWVHMWIKADRGDELARVFMWSLTWAGIFCAFAIMLQMVGMEDILSPWLKKSPHFPRHSGFLSQPNLCASLMSCSLASLVFMGAKEEDKAARPSLWRLIAMAMMLLGIYGTGSRTGFLEILALSIIFTLLRKKAEISWVWCAMVVWQIMLYLAADLLSSSGILASQSTAATLNGAESSGTSRLQILKDTWTVIQTAPWFGVGWRHLQLAEVLNPLISEPADHSHNLFVQIQAELGILGSLSMLVFVGYWLIRNQPWFCSQGYQLAMFCVLTVLSFHSMLEYPLWHALHLFIFGFALSLLPSAQWQFKLPRYSLIALAALLLSMTFWVSADHEKSLKSYENYMLYRSKPQLKSETEDIWWFKLVSQSIFIFDEPIKSENKDYIRQIALENASLYDQSQFVNLPLLKIMILDGKTAIANNLATRMCKSYGTKTMTAIQQHLVQTNEAPYQQWLDQRPESAKHCDKP